MNSSQYDAWEARHNTFARELAQQCLDSYNTGHYKYSFSINMSKHITDYILVKVFHILRGSTPRIGFGSTTRNHRGMTRVCLTFFEHDPLDTDTIPTFHNQEAPITVENNE